MADMAENDGTELFCQAGWVVVGEGGGGLRAGLTDCHNAGKIAVNPEKY